MYSDDVWYVQAWVAVLLASPGSHKIWTLKQRGEPLLAADLMILSSFRRISKAHSAHVVLIFFSLLPAVLYFSCLSSQARTFLLLPVLPYNLSLIATFIHDERNTLVRDNVSGDWMVSASWYRK